MRIVAPFSLQLALTAVCLPGLAGDAFVAGTGPQGEMLGEAEGWLLLVVAAAALVGVYGLVLAGFAVHRRVWRSLDSVEALIFRGERYK